MLALGVASLAPGFAVALSPADVSLEAGPVSSVTSVSPDVFYDAKTRTYFLFTTGMGIGVYTSADGVSWTAVPGASTPAGPVSDPSVIELADGSYRMYYAYRSGTGPGSPCSGKELRYATSTDLVRWSDQPGSLLADLGCGVPNVVRAGSNDFRLYYVRGGASVEHGTYLRTSSDGLVWTAAPALVTPKDLVDPSVVAMPDGSWLMLTADFPAGKTPGPFFQKLYAGTSADGISWEFTTQTPLYTAPEGEGAFDPDMVLLPDGSLRAWWSQGTSAETARIASGAVIVASPPEPVAPTRPTTAWSAKALTVRWSSPGGAPTPDSFAIQVRVPSGRWANVASVAGDRSSASIIRSALPTSAFSLRVVAVMGDQKAASSAVKVRRR